MRIVDLHGDQGRVAPVEFEESADHLVELGPCAVRRRTIGVVAVGSGMDAGQTLAALDKVQERLPAKVRGHLVIWVIEESASGAVKERWRHTALGFQA